MPPSVSQRTTAPLRSLASALALAVALAATGPVRAAGPSVDFERLIAQADEHASEGRPAEALRSYAEAFRAMPEALKASAVGEFVALAAGSSAIEDFRARGDEASLAEGRLVLLSFTAAAKRADPATRPASIDGAKERLAEIDALIPKAAEAPAETTTPSEPAARTEPPSPPEPHDEAPTPARTGLAIGLVVTGGVATLAGLGLVIAGARQVPWYEEKLASEGWATTDEGYDAQIADAERTRNIDVGVGAGVMVAGVALGVTGAVLLAKAKRRDRAVTVVPVLGRDRAMLGVTARF